jgi:acyl-CoA thioesterase
MDSYNKREDFYAAALERINRPGQFSAFAGITVTRLDEQYAEGVLNVTPNNLNPHGIIHGGCLSTLADTVAGMAVVTCGYKCVTLDSNLNYLRPATGNRIFCTSRAKKVGKTVCVFDAELTDEAGKLIASGTYSFYVLGPLQLEAFA